MRISDWSSDVCSSDLPEETAQIVERELGVDPQEAARMMRGTGVLPCRQQLTSAYLGQDGNAGAFARSLHPIARFLPGRGRIREVPDDRNFDNFFDLRFLNNAYAVETTQTSPLPASPRHTSSSSWTHSAHRQLR